MKLGPLHLLVHRVLDGPERVPGQRGRDQRPDQSQRGEPRELPQCEQHASYCLHGGVGAYDELVVLGKRDDGDRPE